VAATTRLSIPGRRRAIAATAQRPGWRSIAIGGLTAAGLCASIVVTAVSQGSGAPAGLRDARGLADAAQAALPDHPSPAQIAAARDLALASLRRAPLNAEAMRVLAVAALDAGDRPRSVALLQAGQRWSRRDAMTAVYLMDDALRRADGAQAVRQADIILRLLPETSTAAFPVLRAVAERPAMQRFVVSALVAKPAWRESFVTDMAQKTSDPALLLDVLSHLADLKSGPEPPEVEALLNRLVKDRRYIDAFMVWRQFIPVTSPLLRGNIRDPDFEGLAAAPPFAWALKSGPAAEAEILQGPPGSPSGGRALRVSYDGVSEAQPAQQLLVLAPGPYRLSVQTYVASPQPGTHLVWSVQCAGGAVLTTTRDAPLYAGWNTLSADFATPDHDCDAQWLTLSAVPQERPADIEVWYGQVQVRRATSSGGPIAMNAKKLSGGRTVAPVGRFRNQALA
jgi:hypothetical protein